VAQAEQLVADVETNITGNCVSSNTNVKRGLVRAGGDLAPKVKTAWPQDYILGSGTNFKVYYQDLSIFEWVNSYIAIVQNECNPQIARLMMSHLRTLMEDVVYHGWEAVKRAHMTILTCLESGEFTWFDELQMAEERRSALNRVATVKDNFTNSGYSRNMGQGQGRGQGKSFSNRAGGVMGKKLVKPCVYFNNNSCSKRGDHEETNVFYKHVCSHCFAADHSVKECSFLTNTM
jgi:hypothetical protein